MEWSLLTVPLTVLNHNKSNAIIYTMNIIQEYECTGYKHFQPEFLWHQYSLGLNVIMNFNYHNMMGELVSNLWPRKSLLTKILDLENVPQAHITQEKNELWKGYETDDITVSLVYKSYVIVVLNSQDKTAEDTTLTCNLRHKPIYLNCIHCNYQIIKLQTIISWDVTPCSLVNIYQCFGGTSCFHLKSQRLSRTSKQTTSKQLQMEIVHSSKISINL